MKLKLILITIFLSFFSNAKALYFVVNNITYEVTSSSAPYTVAVAFVDNYIGDIELPSSVEYNSTSYTVTSIADIAFIQCTSLTSVTIPKSVTRISTFAFVSCTSLTAFKVDPLNPNYNTFDGFLYNKDLTTLIICPIGKSGEITNFPSTISSIENNAFHTCGNITSVIIPNTVSSIGENAFSYCYNLNSVIVPNSVTSISNYTFYGCGRLTSIPISNSVNSIGRWAFYQCASLTSLTIPNSVSSIGDNAFDSCNKLTSFTVDPLNPNFNTFDGILCDKNLTSLICCPGGKTGSVTIPNSITSIKSYAFSFCIGLTSINIPDSVTSIGNHAFFWCRGLTSITIPNSVISIEDNTFDYCMELVSIILPDSVKSIGNMAFNSCWSLSSINLSGSVNFIGEGAFCDCHSLTSINIPSSVTLIGKETFKECWNLTSVNIPDSVTSIEDNAFYGCRFLTSITIPNSVTSIGKKAFFNCFNLSSINIPNSITSINDGTFIDCNSLTLITIPNSVAFIGNEVFENCRELTAIHVKQNTPIDLTNSLYVFNGVNLNTCILYVPVGSKSAYQGAAVWRDFINIVEEGYAPVANAGVDQTVYEGAIVTLDGTGSVDSDGNSLTYSWTAPAGIILSSTTVAKPIFTAPQVTSDTQYAFSLIVKDGTVSSTVDQVVITVKQVNQSPVANAGTDQIVNEGANVTLDGTNSADSDGNFLTYSWTAPAGIILSSTTVAKPTFTAPQVTSDTQYTFTLVVNDGTVSSIADQVVIAVKQVNKEPTANAGADQSVNENSLFTLDGTASSDPENDGLTYLWTAPTGITLSSNTAPKPTFTAPEVTTDTNYTFSLVVNDGSLNSTADQIVVTVKQVNNAPTANAGTDQSVNENSLCSLDGSASSDPDNDGLTYLWTAPTGIALSSNTAPKPTFTASEVTTDTNYTFSLIVNDGWMNSTADQIVITVKNIDKAPYLKNPIKDISVDKRDPDQTIDLQTVFADDDLGDVLNYSVTTNKNNQIVTTKIAGFNLTLSFSSQYTGLSEIVVTANSNGKEVTSKFDVEVKIPTGIDPFESYQDLKMYPNPTTGKIKLVFDKVPVNGIFITVDDITGKNCFKQLISEKEVWIDLSGNVPGIYFVKTDQENFKAQKVILK